MASTKGINKMPVVVKKPTGKVGGMKPPTGTSPSGKNGSNIRKGK